MATIKFYLQSKKNPAGIYVRLRAGRSIDAKARTNYVINPIYWSSTKGSLKHTKDESLKKLDADLQNLKTDLLNYFNASVNQKTINSEWLKSIINPNLYSKIPQSVVDYFEYYREKKILQLSDSTYKKLSVVKNFIIRFEAKFNRKILISEIDENFMNKFLEFGLQQNYSQNYISRNFTSIKTICFDAELNGIKIDSRLRKLKIKEIPTPIIYLTTNEIEAIEKVILKRDALDNARDWLIISCETAQRISDFLNYNSADIRFEKNKSGKKVPLLDLTQKKTKTKLAVPLSKKVMSILEKRHGQFPGKISDQKYNQHIKIIAKNAGLTHEVYGGKQDPKTKRKVFKKYPKWELVTSHIGRRSFATNHNGKTPTTLIMAMTGHKTEKEFLKYIGKAETSKAIQLSEYIN